MISSIRSFACGWLLAAAGTEPRTGIRANRASSSRVRMLVLRYSMSRIRMTAATIPANVARSTISETWGATGSGTGTASWMIWSEPFGTGQTAVGDQDHLIGDAVGKLRRLGGVAVLDPDRQDPGLVVGDHPGRGGQRTGRHADGPGLLDGLVDHRRGGHDLGVGLDEQTG